MPKACAGKGFGRWARRPSDPDVLLKYQVLENVTKDSWSKPIVVRRSEVIEQSQNLPHRKKLRTFEFQFPNGRGSIVIYLGFLSEDEQEELTNELSTCGYFRSQTIQGTNEPRVHFYVHFDATDDPNEAQPGYGYNNNSIRCKSGPLRGDPSLHGLCRVSERVKDELLDGNDPNIGVNCICYRCASDSISPHADDNQGEIFIATIVVQDNGLRYLEITPQKLRKHTVRMRIYLQPGDAYRMDRTMQKFFYHAIPKLAKEKSTDPNETQRLVVVYRRGKKVMIDKDTGTLCDLTAPKPKEHMFGHVPGVVEGGLYAKRELVETDAHLSLQTGVSGDMRKGCNAIVISGEFENGMGNGEDHLSRVIYYANSSKGGKAMLTSARRRQLIRTFRSNKLTYCFKARYQCKKNKKKFRYDGLYRIIAAFVRTEDGPWDSLPLDEAATAAPTGMYRFTMERAEDQGLSNRELVLQSLRAKTLSLPTTNCPCPCECIESKDCSKLAIHSDENLIKHFVGDSIPSIVYPGSQVAAKVWVQGELQYIQANVDAVNTNGNTCTVSDIDGSGKPRTVSKSRVIPVSDLYQPKEGSRCLAVYPDTTTFYEARVVSTKRGRIMVEFDNDAGRNGSSKRLRIDSNHIVPADYQWPSLLPSEVA